MNFPKKFDRYPSPGRITNVCGNNASTGISVSHCLRAFVARSRRYPNRVAAEREVNPRRSGAGLIVPAKPDASGPAAAGHLIGELGSARGRVAGECAWPPPRMI
jgi:hypothetical protein